MRFVIAGEFVIRYTPPPSQPGWDGPLVLRNGVTTAGLNYLLNQGFRAGSRPAGWFIRLIDDAGFSALSSSDTHASHPGWAEFLGVASGQGVAWSPPAAADGILATTTPATIGLTASGTIRGAFLASQQATGSGSGPVLYSTAAADAGRAVAAGGSLSLTYTLKLIPR